MIVWVFGGPFTIFMILRRKASSLNTPETLTLYGFWYLGLKRNLYYWLLLIELQENAYNLDKYKFHGLINFLSSIYDNLASCLVFSSLKHQFSHIASAPNRKRRTKKSRSTR